MVNYILLIYSKKRYPNNKSIGRLTEKNLLNIYCSNHHWVLMYSTYTVFINNRGKIIRTIDEVIPEHLYKKTYNNNFYIATTDIYNSFTIRDLYKDILYVYVKENELHVVGDIRTIIIPFNGIKLMINVNIYPNIVSITVLDEDNRLFNVLVSVTKDTHEIGICEHYYVTKYINNEYFCFECVHYLTHYVVRGNTCIKFTTMLYYITDIVEDILIDQNNNMFYIGPDNEILKIDPKYKPYIESHVQVKSARFV